MRTFSLRTLGFTRHGGRQEIGILGNKSSVRQYGNALLGVCHGEVFLNRHITITRLVVVFADTKFDLNIEL